MDINLKHQVNLHYIPFRKPLNIYPGRITLPLWSLTCDTELFLTVILTVDTGLSPFGSLISYHKEFNPWCKHAPSPGSQIQFVYLGSSSFFTNALAPVAAMPECSVVDFAWRPQDSNGLLGEQ